MYDGVMVQLYAFLASVRDEFQMVSFTPQLPCPHRKIPLNPLEGEGFILLQICESSAENRETSPVLSILTTLTELSRPVRQFVRSDNIEKQSGKESDRQTEYRT